MGLTRRPWDSFRRYSESMFEAIGGTPLVKLGRAAAGVAPEIFAKIEWYSPSGSLKDRIYYNMISKAEERGNLRPGMTILECSTGNAGIACAFVAAVKGYPCIVVMPEGMSDERKKLMRAYGAELVFTPGGESDVDLSLRKLEEIRASNVDDYWVPAQFDNLDNNEAHYLTTGPEIWEQLEGRVDAVVASQGTGGWVSGVGKCIRERNPKALLFAVEPEECPLLSRRGWGPHGIEGIGDGFVPKALDLSLLNGIVTTTTEESVEMARRLAREEGIFCGISSGCNVAAAVKLARAHPELGRVVTNINDTGQRYFTTALCGEEKHVEIPERDHGLDPYSAAALSKYAADWEIIG
ncbi:MAG: PLP-dependent cysteine synthase family protein [Candidatus Tectomicrobia bacterium]|nr:PLP-dependent cysteine synthase family protein [Candidatus Tectomicrobia bacterium]